MWHGLTQFRAKGVRDMTQKGGTHAEGQALGLTPITATLHLGVGEVP